MALKVHLCLETIVGFHSTATQVYEIGFTKKEASNSIMNPGRLFGESSSKSDHRI